MNFNPDIMKIKLCKKCKGLGYRTDLKGRPFICAECAGTGRLVEQNIVSEFPLNMLDDLFEVSETFNKQETAETHPVNTAASAADS